MQVTHIYLLAYECARLCQLFIVASDAPPHLLVIRCLYLLECLKKQCWWQLISVLNYPHTSALPWKTKLFHHPWPAPHREALCLVASYKMCCLCCQGAHPPGLQMLSCAASGSLWLRKRCLPRSGGSTSSSRRHGSCCSSCWILQGLEKLSTCLKVRWIS